MNKFVLIISCFLILSLQSVAQIIPEDRMIEWNPGIPGGITEINTTIKNVVDFGADPKGVNDSFDAFIKTMDALPASGGIVFIPEGTFKIDSKITIKTDNLCFRGVGVNSKLIMTNKGNSFEIIKNVTASWQKISADYIKGSKIISVEDGSKFIAGQFVEIEEDNNPEIMYTKPEWKQSWAENVVGQICEVKSVVGNHIELKSPLHFNFSSAQNVRARPVQMIKNVGFENLYIEKTYASGNTFYFSFAAFCWLHRVESYHTRKSHVSLYQSFASTISQSYFHHSFSYGGGGSGYGIECGLHTTDILAEDNVFNMLRHAMLVQVGANGNVFGYNYSINTVQGDGETNLNQGWIPPDISIHGHYTFMNLFEGNEVNEIGISDYWGPVGPGNTFFRNKVNGEGIFIYDHSNKQNIIGNEAAAFINENNSSSGLIFHGNILNGVVKWDPEIKSFNLPDSYYLNSIPVFFIEKNWPLFGPDIINRNKLPAQIRFEKGNPIL